MSLCLLISYPSPLAVYPSSHHFRNLDRVDVEFQSQFSLGQGLIDRQSLVDILRANHLTLRADEV